MKLSHGYFLKLILRIIFMLCICWCDVYSQNCNNDNRVPEVNNAIGRLREGTSTGVIPGTVFILQNGKLAGVSHLFDNTDNENYWVEFHVKPSVNGQMVDSDPQDRYLVDENTIYKSGSVLAENDWAVFEVFPNQITGLRPLERQGVSLMLGRGKTSFAQLSAVGYGKVINNSPLNHTLQKSTGALVSKVGNLIKHSSFIMDGNSGCPIIDEAGEVIAIQSSECTNNEGFLATSVDNSGFWNNTGLGEILFDQVLDNSTRIGTFSRWNIDQFSPPINPPKRVTVPLAYPEIFQADINIQVNQKYNRWNNEGNVTNFREFYTQTSTLINYTAFFKPTQNSVKITASLIDAPNVIGGNIKFRDPYLIDYFDPDFDNTKRSRGNMTNPNPNFSPQWYSRPVGTEGFKPDYNTDYGGNIYKGVFLNENQTFDPQKPIYTIGVPSLQQTINGVTGYFQNWGVATGDALFQDPFVSETGVVFKQTSTTVTAYYKGSLATNVNTSFTNSGQRKIVKTSDGVLHLIYESIGKIWYEQSTNGGTSWCQPFELISNNCKLPTVSTYGNKIILAYQKDINSNAAIHIEKFNPFAGGLQSEAIAVLSTSTSNTNPTNPVIICSNDGLLLLVWQEGGYIKYQFFVVAQSSISLYTAYYNGGFASQSSSFSPALGLSEAGTAKTYHLAFERRNPTNSNIMYRTMFVPSLGASVNVQTLIAYSSGTGYTWNFLPSVIALNGDGYARVTWNGQRLNPIDPDVQENVSLFKISNSSNYWSYGNLVTSTQINRSTSGFLFAYTTNGSIYYKTHTSYYHPTVYPLNSIIGGTVQVSEGLTNNQFYVSALNSSIQPYRFSFAPVTLSKGQSQNVANGRSGVLVQDSTEFYFVLGDITVDGEPVEFTSFHDTLKLPTVNDVNQVLITKSFQLTNTSQFFYSIQYGTTDSLSAVSVFGETNSVDFKVELIDDLTNEILGSYDNISFNANSPIQYNNLAYQVNTDGVGSRTVRLRLVVSHEGLEPTFGVTNRQAAGSVLGKRERQIKKISFKGSMEVKEFAVAQNYPNPFNPSTTINYQIPKDGFVSLKVFDTLGREVATLVNDFKAIGLYTIQFDARSLSSGIYYYKINTKDFSTVKKMVLMK